jgi:hypothetical protein
MLVEVALELVLPKLLVEGVVWAVMEEGFLDSGVDDGLGADVEGASEGEGEGDDFGSSL